VERNSNQLPRFLSLHITIELTDEGIGNEKAKKIALGLHSASAISISIGWMICIPIYYLIKILNEMTIF
jgi:hypothetical protein